jgi:predicted nuclease of predicted toxin-antitoxin system
LKLLGCKLLADENIHPRVVQFLRQLGCDIADVLSLGLGQAMDEVILTEAVKQNRIVLTHDRDFGRLAILFRQPFHGIVFLRPGHVDPQFTIATLQTIDSHDFDFLPSFILVARRRGAQVQLRMRRW